MSMNGGDLRVGLTVGARVVLGRALPGGSGAARRYTLRCGCCGAESVMTHRAILTLLKMLKAGRPDRPCPECAGVSRLMLAARRMSWGKKPEELWRPGRTSLPAGSISPAVAWPVPGRVARP